jgi:hypothetical protein
MFNWTRKNPAHVTDFLLSLLTKSSEEPKRVSSLLLCRSVLADLGVRQASRKMPKAVL